MSAGAKPVVKERPILFKGPLVRAILEGRKTQTRRVIKPQPHALDVSYGDIEESEKYPGEWFQWENAEPGPSFFCPHGTAGDCLWVREMFYIAEPYSWGTDPSGEAIIYQGVPHGPVHYAADGPPANTPNRHYPSGLRGGAYAAPDPHAIWLSHPSIHMPRWASRITLEITDVKVERLWDITEEDANSEGVCDSANYSAREHFAKLWTEINGKRAGCTWNDNPWCWCISFRRLTPGGPS